jgi:hypothetical protein
VIDRVSTHDLGAFLRSLVAIHCGRCRARLAVGPGFRGELTFTGQHAAHVTCGRCRSLVLTINYETGDESYRKPRDA